MKRLSLAALSLTVLLAACQQQSTVVNPRPPVTSSPTQAGGIPTPDIDSARIILDPNSGAQYVSDQLVVGLGGLDSTTLAAQLGIVVGVERRRKG